MSSSKYADLPDIDTFSPDVFETSSPSSPGGAAQKIRGVTPSDSSDSEADDDPDASFVTAAGSGKRKGGVTGGTLPSSSSLSRLAAAKRGDAASSTQEDKAAIERSRLDVSEATRRFRDAAGADASGVDFSDQLPPTRRKRAQRYPPRSVLEVGYYGQERAGLKSSLDTPYGAPSSSESRAERLQRLKYESEELEKELKEEQDARGHEWSDSKQEASEESAADARMLDQVRHLRGDLSRFDGILQQTAVRDTVDAQAWQTQARSLLDQLKRMDLGEAQNATAARGTRALAGPDRPHNVAGSSSELAGLESRLYELEQLVGVSALLDQSDSPPHPLLPTLSRLEHLVTLLTHPRHLDSISRRIKVLVSELERAQEARRKLGFSASISNMGPAAAGFASMLPEQAHEEGAEERSGTGGSSEASKSGLSLEQRRRLDGLFPVLERIDGLLPLVPVILSRLQTLQDLHSSAGTFAKDLDGVKEAQTQLRAGDQDLRTLLNGVKDSLESNRGTVERNLESIGRRMEDLQARLQRLQ